MFYLQSRLPLQATAALVAFTAISSYCASSAHAMGSPPTGPTPNSHPEEYCADREQDGFYDPTDCTIFHVENGGSAEYYDMAQSAVFRRKNLTNLVDNCPQDTNNDQLDANANGVGDICEYASLTVGANHACALRADGAASCWGDDEFGQASAPVWGFTQITAGRNHTCGLTKSDDPGEAGRVLCWGDNSLNQLAARPGQYVKVRANGDVTCAVDKDGAATCWGSCGDAISCTPNHPLKFFDVTPAFDVSPEGSDTPLYGYCGRDSQLKVTCFNGRPPPQAPALSFAAFEGGDRYGCGIQQGGSIHCFGRFPAEAPEPPDAMLTPPVGQFANLSVGLDHACAVGFNGQIRCWGANDFGKSTPPAGQFSSVFVGDNHSCARAGSGKITCWGDTGVDEEPFPNALLAHKLRPRAAQYADLSANEFTACGVTFGNKLVCSSLAIPVFKVPAGKFYSVNVGEGRSCARRTDGKTVCWDPETGASEEFTGVRQIATRRFTNRTNTGDQTAEYLCGLFQNSQRIFCRSQGQPTPVESDFSFGPKFNQIGVMGERMVCGLTVDQRFLCQQYGAGSEIEIKPGTKFEQLSCNNGQCCAHDGFDAYCFDAMGTTTRVDVSKDRSVCRAITKNDHQYLQNFATRCFDEAGCTTGIFNVQVCQGPQPKPLDRRVHGFAMGPTHGCMLNEKTEKARCWSDENDGFAPVAPPDIALDYIASGTQFACGVKQQGTPLCWGKVRRESIQQRDFRGRLLPKLPIKVVTPIFEMPVFEAAPVKEVGTKTPVSETPVFERAPVKEVEQKTPVSEKPVFERAPGKKEVEP